MDPKLCYAETSRNDHVMSLGLDITKGDDKVMMPGLWMLVVDGG